MIFDYQSSRIGFTSNITFQITSEYSSLDDRLSLEESKSSVPSIIFLIVAGFMFIILIGYVIAISGLIYMKISKKIHKRLEAKVESKWP